MKSDLGIFLTGLLGLGLVYFGFIGFGLMALFSGGLFNFPTLFLGGVGICGLFLRFKAKRRTGHIIYNGGDI